MEYESLKFNMISLANIAGGYAIVPSTKLGFVLCDAFEKMYT